MVALLCWRADRSYRARQIDRAQLFGPEIIIGHVAKPPESAQSPVNLDAPAGFLHHLTMQRGKRLLTRVNTATGQLVFRQRVLLESGQNVVALQKQGIDPRTPPVSLPCPHRFTKSTYHPLGPELAAPI